MDDIAIDSYLQNKSEKIPSRRGEQKATPAERENGRRRKREARQEPISPIALCR